MKLETIHLSNLTSEVESVNREVKKGSDTTISCVITGLTETATVTWRTSTGPVPAEKFTPVQGSHSAGTQTSTLAVDGTLVNDDTAYTCRVTSGSLPDSSHPDTTVNLNVYGTFFNANSYLATQFIIWYSFLYHNHISNLIHTR